RSGRFADLVALYEREAAREPAPHLFEAMGRLLAERLGDLDGAIECYQKVCALAPHNLPALRELARLYARGSRWQELISVSEREIELITDPRRKVDLYAR